MKSASAKLSGALKRLDEELLGAPDDVTEAWHVVQAAVSASERYLIRMKQLEQRQLVAESCLSGAEDGKLVKKIEEADVAPAMSLVGRSAPSVFEKEHPMLGYTVEIYDEAGKAADLSRFVQTTRGGAKRTAEALNAVIQGFFDNTERWVKLSSSSLRRLVEVLGSQELPLTDEKIAEALKALKKSLEDEEEG